MLPDWFEALNRDFPYQLICIGGYAPVYITDKISRQSAPRCGKAAGIANFLAGIRHHVHAECPSDSGRGRKTRERGAWHDRFRDNSNGALAETAIVSMARSSAIQKCRTCCLISTIVRPRPSQITPGRQPPVSGGLCNGRWSEMTHSNQSRPTGVDVGQCEERRRGTGKAILQDFNGRLFGQSFLT